MKNLGILITILMVSIKSYAQYSPEYVSSKIDYYNGTKISVLNMSRKNERVKVKYFAAREGNTSVYQRFLSWKNGKNIIGYTSGTYMDACDASISRPVGLCIDNGNVVNNTLTYDLDGFVIVYATGGLVVSNLKDKDLTITYQDGTKRTVDIRDQFGRTTFVGWANDMSATVFQTHLLVYKNQLRIKPGSSRISNRRFIMAGKDENGNIHYLVISTLANMSLYDASVTAYNYIRSNNILTDIIYMINVDPGCQDVYRLFSANGKVESGIEFTGTQDVRNAANLVVYYYE
jgi:hypothetical protein